MRRLEESLRQNLKWLVLGLGLIYSVLHPMTRPVILFILPLGVKPDDVIVVTFTVLFILVWRKLNV
jgi:hypothetical protein